MADEILRIGASFDVSQIVAGSREAVASFDSATASAIKMATEMRAGGASLDQIRTSMIEGGVAASTTEAAIAALASSETEATTAAEAETGALTGNTAALVENAVASNGAASSTARMTSAMGAARVEMGALEGSTGMMAGGLARVAAQSELLAPIIQAAFVPFAIAAFADILVIAAEKVHKVYENVVLLKEAIAALDKATMAQAERAATLNETYEESLARRLEQQGRLTEAAEAYRKAAEDKPLQLPKIDDKMFKQFNAEFVSFLQAVHTSSDTPSVITRINAEAESTESQLAKARDALKDVTAEANLPGEAAPDIGLRFKRAQADVDELTKKLGFLNGAIGEIESQSGIAANTLADKLTQLGNKGEEAMRKDAEATEKAVRAHDDLVNSAKRVTDSYEKLFATEVEIQTKETEMFATGTRKDIEESVKATQKRTDDWIKYYDETNKLAEEQSTREFIREEASVSLAAKVETEKLASKNVNEFARIRIIEQINAQELASLENLENQKLAKQLEYIEKQKSILLGGQTEQQFTATAGPEQLTELLKLNGQIEAAQDAHVSKMRELDQKAAENAQRSANDMEAAWLKIFTPINRAFDESVKGIILGTQTAAQAWQRMGQNMLISTVQSLEAIVQRQIEHFVVVDVLEKSALVKKLITFLGGEAAKKAAATTGNAAEVSGAVATEAAKTAAVLTGSATRTATIVTEEATKHAAEDVAAIASATTAAGLGAAWAFESVMAALPFPENVAVAPPTAAATFASIEAVGFPKAEKGAVIEKDMPIFAHAKEMVLPANISVALQAAIPSMTQFSSVMKEPSAYSTSAASSPVVPAVQGFATAMNSLSQNISTSSSSQISTNNRSSSVQRGDTHVHIAPQQTPLSHDDIVRAVQKGIRKGQLRGPNF